MTAAMPALTAPHLPLGAAASAASLLSVQPTPEREVPEFELFATDEHVAALQVSEAESSVERNTTSRVNDTINAQAAVGHTREVAGDIALIARGMQMLRRVEAAAQVLLLKPQFNHYLIAIVLY
jgi:hypothetical protein